MCVIFLDRCWVCIYHLSVWLNLNFLHISQGITLRTQSCLLLYSLCYYYYYHYNSYYCLLCLLGYLSFLPFSQINLKKENIFAQTIYTIYTIYIYIYIYIYIQIKLCKVIHLIVPKNETGAFWSPSTMVANTLNSSSPKLVDKFTYLRSSVSLTETDIDTQLTKAWRAIDRLLVKWKSDQTDKMKRSFFQAAIVSILLYGCTTRTLTKQLEEKLDGNYTRMLQAILNKSRRQHPTKQHLPPITKTIQVRQTRHAGHCWRSRDELKSDVLLWTPSHGRAKAGWQARTYIQQLCEDTGCSPEDLPEAMNNRERWWERVLMAR